jgi:hypothetical protein
MRVRQYMAAILGPAIALIVLVAMPSAATAHAGHHDRGAQTAAFDIAKAKPVTFQAREPAPVEARAYTAVADAPAPPCDGVSCCKKACAACGLAIPSAADAFEPVWTGLSTPLPDMRAFGDVRPEDLSRPPKSLA